MASIEVTNRNKFRTVLEVDTSDLEFVERMDGFHGTIRFDFTDGRAKDLSGDHGRYDYEQEYGFVLIQD